MSGKLMGEVFALKLSEKERLILLALADHAKDDGTGARLGIKRICWKTDFGARTVERYLSRLRKAGIIEKVGGGGHNLAVEYKINLSAGEKKPPFGANNESESTANHLAAESEPAKDDSAANVVADEQPIFEPENNHSAAKTGIIQPPKSAHSAATALAAQPNNRIKPLPLPAKRRALDFPEARKSEVVSNTRARETAEANQNKIFANSIRETADAQNRVHQFFCETFEIQRTIHKTARRQIKLKFDAGYDETDWKAAIIGCRIAPIDEHENQLKCGFWTDILRNFEYYRKIGLSNFEGSAN